MGLLIIMISFACIASGSSQLQRRAGSCTSPDGRAGICQPLANCESLLPILKQSSRNPNFVSFLKTSNQICGNAYSVICCPLPSVNNRITKTQAQVKLPTIAEGCGIKPDEDRIQRYEVVGGVTSVLGAWPWIALIGYRNQPSDQPFKCGGTLITNRHVLTAAHCIKNDLTFVRLGEHDLSVDSETAHIDVPVSKVLKHPQFNRVDGRNDIALLHLARPVQFTEKITPICLPTTPQLLAKSFVNSDAHIAGWGRLSEGGKTATVLQQLQISVYANEMCKNLYKKNNKLVSEAQFDETVLCAGNINGGQDSCEGDSGGPLMIYDRNGEGSRYFMIGVVSYGIGCARSETPGVYARVAKFMDWIQKGISDNR